MSKIRIGEKKDVWILRLPIRCLLKKGYFNELRELVKVEIICMTIETKRITSNFPSVFVDCEFCHKVIFSDNSSSNHAVRTLAQAAANWHNDAFQNLHNLVMVISESPRAE